MPQGSPLLTTCRSLQNDTHTPCVSPLRMLYWSPTCRQHKGGNPPPLPIPYTHAYTHIYTYIFPTVLPYSHLL